MSEPLAWVVIVLAGGLLLAGAVTLVRIWVLSFSGRAAAVMVAATLGIPALVVVFAFAVQEVTGG